MIKECQRTGQQAAPATHPVAAVSGFPGMPGDDGEADRRGLAAVAILGYN